ncbi:MAG: DUF4091 domain-containing protein [bacterium]|nr:DUF4091 domain-containing protein [bacterium]
MRFKVRLLPIALLCVFSSLVAAEPPVADGAARDWIRSWLVCGPFPNPLADGVDTYRHDETTLGFYTDYLASVGGETGLAPEDGLQVAAPDGSTRTWRAHTSPNDYVDFCTVFDENQQVVAYAACVIEFEQAGDAILALGSNDGIKAWLNGHVIWENHRPRGAERDQDFVRVTVRKGPNLLLAKVDQGWGNWGLYARVIDKTEAVARLMDDPEPIIEAEYSDADGAATACFGRASSFRIVAPVPEYTATVYSHGGNVVASGEAALGELVPIDWSSVPGGPYRLECVTDLPNGLQGADTLHIHRGASTCRLLLYGGREIPGAPGIEMLDAQFKPVEEAFEQVEPGVYGVLRTDVAPFYLRMLVDSPALGRRWYLADNGGRGFSCPPGRSNTIDLPREVVKTLRSGIESAVRKRRGSPEWLRQDVDQRLRLTRGKPFPDRERTQAADVTQTVAVLSSLKARVPSSGDVAVWSAPSTEKVARHEPMPGIEHKALHIGLARNEYEACQLVMRPSEELRELTVAFDTLRSEEGLTFSETNLHASGVGYVDVTQVSDEFGTLGLWPDPLPPLPRSNPAPARVNTPLWITAHAPKGQPAGVYKGSITVSASGREVACIPIEVTVFAFTLPEATHTETAYGVGVNRDWHGPLSDDQAREVHDLYMRFCAERRISPYSPHAGSEFAISFEGDPPKAAVDFTAFDVAMERYLDEFGFNAFRLGGIPGELAGHPRYSSEYDHLFKDAYGQVQEHLREKGWLDKAYWYWVDEPQRTQYADVMRGMQLLKEACPDIRRLLTCNQEQAPVPYFHDTVNLWVPIMDRYDLDRAHARQALGETIWWYVCTGPKAPYPNNFIDHPAINHRVRFWMIDAFGLDGSLYWSVTSWRQNPWEQAMAISPSGGPWGNGDGRLLYPPRRTRPDVPVVEPPVSSIRFENLRDGLEDREYLLLLDTVARHNKDAAKTLTRARSALVETMTCYDQNPIVFAATRHMVADALEEGMPRVLDAQAPGLK